MKITDLVHLANKSGNFDTSNPSNKTKLKRLFKKN